MQFSKTFFVAALSLIAGVQSAAVKRDILSDVESQISKDKQLALDLVAVAALPATQAVNLASLLEQVLSSLPTLESADDVVAEINSVASELKDDGISYIDILNDLATDVAKAPLTDFADAVDAVISVFQIFADLLSKII